MLIPLSNQPRAYAWGSKTLLAELEGRPAASGPEAEVWFGDHPADPADVAAGGTLREITGGTLPYLLKILAADAPLSIQAHPTKAQAEAGFAREAGLAADDPQRNYRDDNHKPELLVALSDRFDALVGLRPASDTLRLLGSLPQHAGVRALSERLRESGDGLREAVSWALSAATASDIDEVTRALDAEVPEFAGALQAVRRAARRNPGDPGIIVALLMNHIALAPGEGLFLPAGVLHAYQGGLGVEIMAASDNVLRGGLTRKHVDVPELLAILDSAPHEVRVITPEAETGVYPAPAPDFSLRRVRVAGAPLEVALAGPAILLTVSGEVEVATAAASLRVLPGRAVFADAAERLVHLRGSGEVFVAEPGE